LNTIRAGKLVVLFMFVYKLPIDMSQRPKRAASRRPKAKDKLSEEEEEPRQKTTFFPEKNTPPFTGLQRRGLREDSPATVSKLLQILRDQWQEKKKEELNEVIEEEPSKLQDIMNDAQSIATVKKVSVFGSDLTEEEQAIIQRRVELQRKQFEEYTRREVTKKTRKIRTVHKHITEKEALVALKESEDDEAEAITKLTQISFLQEVRQKIALEGTEEKKEEKQKEETKEPMADDTSVNLAIPEDRKLISRKRKNPRKRVGKLKLDDAIKKGEKGDFEGWSEARIRAWRLIDKNPNAYYYRFNPPGEEQRNGPWSKEEKELFFKRIEEVGVNGQWGIFSITIPGRVGYQCSNFYRHLIQTGKIKDDNYVIDENGKAHYLFSKGICKHKKSHKRDAGEEKVGQVKTNKKRQRSKKKKGEGEDEGSSHESDDTDYCPPTSWKKQKTEGGEEEEIVANKTENPLPGFIDPITLEEVERPAISPSGHVMGYKSWSRCLSSNGGICPLTKQPLKKRDLVVLTWKNIDQYLDRIANWNVKNAES
jgi:hypothetical protein